MELSTALPTVVSAEALAPNGAVYMTLESAAGPATASAPIAGTKRKRTEMADSASSGGDAGVRIKSELRGNGADGESSGGEEEEEEEGDAGVEGEANGGWGRGRRTRRARTVDFTREYRPGEGLHHPDIFITAQRIATELSANFAEPTDVARVKALSESHAKAMGVLRTSEVEAETTRDSAALSKLSKCKAEVSGLEAELARARADMMRALKRNMIDTVQRVTLMKDASDVNDRIAAASGGDAIYIAPPKTTCNHCGNADEAFFTSDYKSGDMTCTRCGAVAMEHQVYDGDWTRSFEGEENTSSIGPAPDPFLSTRYVTNVA